MKKAPTTKAGTRSKRHGPSQEGRSGYRLGDRGQAPGADLDRRHQCRVGTDEGAVADHRSVLVRAIVVAGNGAGAEVHPGPDIGVADVGEVIDLGAQSDDGLLDFDEVADMGTTDQVGPGPQPRVGSDAAVRADLGILQHAVFQDLDAVSDPDVAQHRVGADPDVVAEDHVAFDDDVDVDADVAAVAQVPAQIEARGVGQGDTGEQQLLGAVALIRPLQGRQLQTIVHAFGFHRVVRLRNVHRHAVVYRHFDHVGQVILALRIVVGESAEPVAQARGTEQHDAGVASFCSTMRSTLPAPSRRMRP